MITDFQDGVDRLQFDWTRQIESVAPGADTEIIYDRNVLTVLGVSADVITSDEFHLGSLNPKPEFAESGRPQMRGRRFFY